MNHYVVLGIPIDADDRLIRSAFRSLARRYHPDAGEGSSPEKFRRIVEAYETLSDPVRRAQYDRSLRSVPVTFKPGTARVEPMVPRRRRPEPIYRPSGPLWTTGYFDHLVDELWRALEDDHLLSWPFARRFRVF